MNKYDVQRNKELSRLANEQLQELRDEGIYPQKDELIPGKKLK